LIKVYASFHDRVEDKSLIYWSCPFAKFQMIVKQQAQTRTNKSDSPSSVQIHSLIFIHSFGVM